jgi:hypothetical protein
MITIKDLKFESNLAGITRACVTFDNGRGASVITGPYTYSSHDRPYEIAVLDKNGHLDYSTPVTDDVCGYLTEDDANEILKKIQELPEL